MNKTLFWFLPVGVLMWFGARQNELLFHTLADLWAIGIALLAGYVGISTFRYTRNTFAAGLGLLFGCLGAVDLFHVLTYEGMGVFPFLGADQSIQLGILVRWIQGLGFLVVLFCHRRRGFLPAFGILLSCAAAAGVVCVFFSLFPVRLIAGSGVTPFKIWNAVAISFVLGLGALAVWRSSYPAIRPYRNALVVAILLSLGSETAFALYSDAFSVMNMLGHLFNVASFWIFLNGFLIPSVHTPLLTLFSPLFSGREALLGAMTGPSGILERSGKVLAANEHLQPAGTEFETNLPFSVREALSDAGGNVLSGLDQVAQAQVPLHFEFREKGKDFRAGIYPMPSKRAEGERQYALISWDVTGEKKARAELAETRDSLLEAQAMALLGTMRVDMATGKVICSKSFLALFGLSPEAEIDFQWYNSRVLPEDRERIDAIRESAWRSEKDAYRFECRILRVDDVVRNIRVWVRTIRDESGQATELLGTFQDNTEQVRLQEELEVSEARYRSYIDKAPVGVFVADEQGRFLKTNPAASAITGFSPEELLQMGIPNCFSSEKRSLVLQKFQSVREKGGIWLQAPFLRKDGTEGFCEIQAVSLPDGTHMALVQDLTVKHEALESARTSQERYKAIFETIMEGFAVHEAIFDEAGKLCDYRFIEVNPAFEKLTCLSVQNVLGKTASEIFDDPFDYWLGTCEEVLRTGQSVREAGFSAQFGRWYEVIAFPLGENCFGTAFRDVTEEREQEEVLEKINIELGLHVKELDRAWEQTIRVLADLVEFRDPYTTGHQKRVAELAEAICLEMGLDADLTVETVRAALVHDIGKIQVPSDFLSKPGRLSRLEFEVIKKHPQVAADLLKGIDLPWPLGDIVGQHHERLDGSGYPRGLKGDEILLQARIIAVADVVEAMASHRPYRPSLGIDVTLEEVEKGAGTKYDPEVAAACLRLFNEKGFKLPE